MKIVQIWSLVMIPCGDLICVPVLVFIIHRYIYLDFIFKLILRLENLHVSLSEESCLNLSKKSIPECSEVRFEFCCHVGAKYMHLSTFRETERT